MEELVFILLKAGADVSILDEVDSISGFPSYVFTCAQMGSTCFDLLDNSQLQQELEVCYSCDLYSNKNLKRIPDMLPSVPDRFDSLLCV